MLNPELYFLDGDCLASREDFRKLHEYPSQGPSMIAKGSDQRALPRQSV